MPYRASSTCFVLNQEEIIINLKFFGKVQSRQELNAFEPLLLILGTGNWISVSHVERSLK